MLAQKTISKKRQATDQNLALVLKEIDILQRYCSSVDSSISDEEYIDIAYHVLEDLIISDYKIFKLTLQLNSSRKLRLKVKKKLMIIDQARK